MAPGSPTRFIALGTRTQSLAEVSLLYPPPSGPATRNDPIILIDISPLMVAACAADIFAYQLPAFGSGACSQASLG
jgi:hypothetical protein